MTDLQTTIGSPLRLLGGLIAIPIQHGLRQVSIPCRDGLTEVANVMSTSSRPTIAMMIMHSFSGNETEITVNPALATLATVPNAVIICPHLFGPAGGVNTCGSPAQMAHALDVLDWTEATYAIPRGNARIAGVSGGGGLTAQFIGTYPDRASKASTWNGYNNFVQWRDESIAAGTVYASLMDTTLSPLTGEAEAEVLLAQSPSAVLGNITCHLTINDGVLDTDIPSHHRTDMAAAVAGCTYIPYQLGHGPADWPTIISQLI